MIVSDFDPIGCGNDILTNALCSCLCSEFVFLGICPNHCSILKDHCSGITSTSAL